MSSLNKYVNDIKQSNRKIINYLYIYVEIKMHYSKYVKLLIYISLII